MNDAWLQHYYIWKMGGDCVPITPPHIQNKIQIDWARINKWVGQNFVNLYHIFKHKANNASYLVSNGDCNEYYGSRLHKTRWEWGFEDSIRT